MAPRFPAASVVERRLHALETQWPGPEHWQQRHFAAAERIYLALWQALAPVYAAALHAEVLDWPRSVAAQQAALHCLLETSHLRQAWRSYSASQAAGRHALAEPTDEAWHQALRDSAIPMREIPLYQGFLRVSCQQMVCLPESVWQSLHGPADAYRPQAVDAATVDRFAVRLARVFNRPAWAVMDGEPSGFPSEPVVWPVHAPGLTTPMSGHGMRDRQTQESSAGPTVHTQDLVAPEWRYEGFYGALRLVDASAMPWRLVVLAPLHFVRRLAPLTDKE